MSNSSSHATSITQFDLAGLGNTLGALLVGSLLSMSYVRFLSSTSPWYTKLYPCSLWGVTCTQTYDYFLDNTDDWLQRSIVRSLLRRILFFTEHSYRLLCCGKLCRPFFILFIFSCIRIIDTLSSAMDSHMIYHYSITDFLNPKSLLEADWYWVPSKHCTS